MLRTARRGALRGTDPCGRVSSAALRANRAFFLVRPRPRGGGDAIVAFPPPPSFAATAAWVRGYVRGSAPKTPAGN